MVDCDLCIQQGRSVPNKAVDKCLVCGRHFCVEHRGADGYCIDDFFASGLF